MSKSLGYYLLRLFWDILRLAFSILRYPLALLFAVWLLGWVLSAFAALMLGLIKPVCDVPVVSALCGNLVTHHPDISQTRFAETPTVFARPDFPALFKLQSASLSELMSSSSEGSQLSLDIKVAQMATSDLISLVKISELSTRDSIADALEAFVDDARVTARGLQKLNAKVSGAADQ